MTPIEFVVKLLLTVWPFIKEMVLEGKSLGNVFKTNKRRAIFSVVIMASFLFNILNVGADVRLFAIVAKYLALDKSYKEAVSRNDGLRRQLDAATAPPVAPLIIPPVVTPVGKGGKARTPPKVPLTNYQALRSTFDDESDYSGD